MFLCGCEAYLPVLEVVSVKLISISVCFQLGPRGACLPVFKLVWSM